MLSFKLSISNRPSKKWKIENNEKVVHFGDSSYEDYTLHKNEVRKQQYLLRHKDPYDAFRHQAGFWARWLLWNKPSLEASVKDVERRFGLKIFIE